jgi:hypothetical protein
MMNESVYLLASKRVITLISFSKEHPCVTLWAAHGPQDCVFHLVKGSPKASADGNILYEYIGWAHVPSRVATGNLFTHHEGPMPSSSAASMPTSSIWIRPYQFAVDVPKTVQVCSCPFRI